MIAEHSSQGEMLPDPKSGSASTQKRKAGGILRRSSSAIASLRTLLGMTRVIVFFHQEEELPDPRAGPGATETKIERVSAGEISPFAVANSSE